MRQITVSLDEELRQQVEAIAARERRSAASVVRQLVAEGLESRDSTRIVVVQGKSGEAR